MERFPLFGVSLHAAVTRAKQATSRSIREVEVPERPDVRAIRARTGLSQTEFARSIGVAKGTVLNWEQGRREPEGPAKVLLGLISKEPGIVQRLLGRRGN